MAEYEAGALPEKAQFFVTGIRADLARVAALSRDGFDGDALLLRQAKEHYLPDTLKAYFTIPDSGHSTLALMDGKSADDVLTEQLRTLALTVRGATNNLLRNSAIDLLANGRFIAAKAAEVTDNDEEYRIIGDDVLASDGPLAQNRRPDATTVASAGGGIDLVYIICGLFFFAFLVYQFAPMFLQFNTVMTQIGSNDHVGEVKAELSEINEAAVNYEADYRGFPGSLDSLGGRYLRGFSIDDFAIVKNHNGVLLVRAKDTFSGSDLDGTKMANGAQCVRGECAHLEYSSKDGLVAEH